MTPAEPESRPTPAGPRPLALHVAVQTLAWSASRLAWPSWRNAWPPSKAAASDRAPDPSPRRNRSAADALRAQLANADPEAFAKAIDAEARARLAEFAEGVVRYRHAPRPPRPPEPPAIWQEGGSRLLDYAGTKRGIGVLVVPSLINRHTILDLSDDRSLMRALAADGFRPFLFDWGVPGAAERGFDLTDYVAGRLERALDAATQASGGPVAAVGYCMGGLLALALAQRRPESVSALALLATPWDFSKIDGAHRRMLAAMRPSVEAALDAFGALPVDALQAMFASLSPFATAAKFRRFAHVDPASDAGRRFVALEDWLNDGVPLAAPVARECLFGWYVDNSTERGQWKIAGRAVKPEEVRQPALAVVPEGDIIVPPASARALVRRLANAETREVPAGHIGMAAGGTAPRVLYKPLAEWLAAVGGK